jgi:hypothetical protein
VHAACMSAASHPPIHPFLSLPNQSIRYFVSCTLHPTRKKKKKKRKQPDRRHQGWCGGLAPMPPRARLAFAEPMSAATRRRWGRWAWRPQDGRHIPFILQRARAHVLRRPMRIMPSTGWCIHTLPEAARIIGGSGVGVGGGGVPCGTICVRGHLRNLCSIYGEGLPSI